MSNPDVPSSNTGISGPGFIALLVGNVATANFYEQKVGLKRDQLAFPVLERWRSCPARSLSPLPRPLRQ